LTLGQRPSSVKKPGLKNLIKVTPHRHGDEMLSSKRSKNEVFVPYEEEVALLMAD
jgi:hypothetical protein